MNTSNSFNILICISMLCALVHTAPKRCKSKNCPAENALERSCKSYFDCQFAPEGCQQTAWFKCDGRKCLCELFGYLHDELGPMEVEWKEHKCGMSLGGPCGNSSAITVHCQPGFKCVNSMCEKSTEPEPEKQRCRPEEGCEFGRERPPCHDPKGCEFGHVNKDNEREELESLEENRPKKCTTNCGGGAGSRRSRVSEFEEPSSGKQSGGGGEDWGDTDGNFRFYSYGKQEDKNCGGKDCGGEGAGGTEVEPASQGGSCGDDGCGKPPPPPPPPTKPSCSGGCPKPPKRPSCGGGGCGRKPRPRPTPPPCDKGCGGGRKPPKPSCSSCGGGSSGGGGHKPSSSGGGHCGEDGCGAPPPPPPPPCGGCPKPKPPCGGEECEDSPPPCGGNSGGDGCGKPACSDKQLQ